MAEREFKATLSKGRSGWCIIFRHPVCREPDGTDTRVRRGLGTRDEAEAQGMVGQMNQILSDPSMWNIAAKAKAEARFDRQIVSAFYDHISPDRYDPWADRSKIITLPSKDEGYAKMQFVGTTGAGKTTLVRQILDTDPSRERFPSIAAAKTTTCDIEIVLAEGGFRAAVSFLPKDQVRQFIADCVANAVITHLEGGRPEEVVRRFLEHSEQRFRLSYILGTVKEGLQEADELSDVDEEDVGEGEDVEVSAEDRVRLSDRLQAHLDKIGFLASRTKDELEDAARSLGVAIERATHEELDTLQELVEDQLLRRDDFHELVDGILDDVESRFDLVGGGEFQRGRDGWPLVWAHTCPASERKEFLRVINRFSSNFAPNFGKLLTPIVQGIRVAGPFKPEWGSDGIPRLVLLDGQGIGHTADASSSVSTAITKRFEVADAIVVVDNAAQPMQAGTCAVLRSLVASGHESKLIVCFTHFDEAGGDNVRGMIARKDHVTGSFDNAIHAISKAYGREAEQALKRLVPDRLVFLSSIQKRLPTSARLTRHELSRLIDMAFSLIQPPAPVAYKPFYDVANLVLAIQKATQEFHDRWKGVLGLGSRSGVPSEHWATVKALTRHIGLLREDEWGMLKPVADLIRILQDQISAFLAGPLEWKPSAPPVEAEVEKLQAIDKIKQAVHKRLHDLSSRRLLEERLNLWVHAFERRGVGSTRVRAKDVAGLYESAAPIPSEMPGPDANNFLFELRELVRHSIVEGGGDVLGWSREPLRIPDEPAPSEEPGTGT